VLAVVRVTEGAASRGLIIRLITQTIRRDPSGSVWIDKAPNLSSPDRSGADQIDAEHQATDLAVGGSNPSRRAPKPQVSTGLPHTRRTSAAEDRVGDRVTPATPVGRPQLPAPNRSAAAGNGSGPQRDSRARVCELVAHERATGTRLHAREVAAEVGISQRRAYELLRDVRAENSGESAP
jgi:hypothetical protein